MVGGLGEARNVNNEEVDIVLALKAKVVEKTGSVEAFEPVKVRTQTVAGTNYFFAIGLGETRYAHVRIHKPLSGEPTVVAVKKDLRKEDEIEYFEA
ncbi:Cystatin-A2 [Diplonema papillatum]|nr:Cystatin-A2 [Diplonema papillatum]